MDGQGQPVRFRDCTCPGTPHDGRDGADDGDLVYMRPALGFAAGAEAYRMMVQATTIIAMTGGGEKGDEPLVDTSRMSELVGPVYIREGVVSWNVVAEDGSPAPLDIDLILGDYTLAYPIAIAGDERYSDVVAAPLVKATKKLSKDGLNGKPTRQTRRSSQRVRSPRKPSSRNGSAGQPSVTGP